MPRKLLRNSGIKSNRALNYLTALFDKNG